MTIKIYYIKIIFIFLQLKFNKKFSEKTELY